MAACPSTVALPSKGRQSGLILHNTMSWGSVGLDGQLGLSIFHVLSPSEALCGESFMRINTTTTRGALPSVPASPLVAKESTELPAVMHGGCALPWSLQSPSAAPTDAFHESVPDPTGISPKTLQQPGWGAQGSLGNPTPPVISRARGAALSPRGWCHPGHGHWCL